MYIGSKKWIFKYRITIISIYVFCRIIEIPEEKMNYIRDVVVWRVESSLNLPSTWIVIKAFMFLKYCFLRTDGKMNGGKFQIIE